MHVVLLTFSANRADAPQHMAGHQAWIEEGFAAGCFQLVGGIRGGVGGAVLVTGLSVEEVEAVVQRDPFVVHDVVVPQIVTVDPARCSPALSGALG